MNPLLLALLQFTVARPHVTITLIPEHSVIVPGVPLRVALRFQLDPGWHIYWRNPGESGIATTVQWTLPRGFAAEPLDYPTPVRLDVAGVVAHVLGGDVVIEATLRVPPDASSPRDGVRIAAQVKYGVCKDACYPGDATVSVDLPVEPGATRNPEWPRADSIFASTRPRRGAIRATVAVRGDTARISVPLPRGCAAGDVTFFPWDRELSPAAVTVPGPRGCGTAVFKLPLRQRPAGSIRGVVVIGGEQRGYEIGQ